MPTTRVTSGYKLKNQYPGNEKGRSFDCCGLSEFDTYRKKSSYVIPPGHVCSLTARRRIDTGSQQATRSMLSIKFLIKIALKVIIGRVWPCPVLLSSKKTESPVFCGPGNAWVTLNKNH
jgi:hypothetical protein